MSIPHYRYYINGYTNEVYAEDFWAIWEKQKLTGLNCQKATSTTKPERAGRKKSQNMQHISAFLPHLQNKKPPKLRLQLAGMLSSAMTPV